MNAILYYLALPFIYLVSILPFSLLYAFSDFLHLIIFHLLGYRKKVVKQNLINAFPDKSQEELQQIMQDFYTYLCDFIVEFIKQLTISKKRLSRHCQLDNDSKELINSLREEKRSFIFVMGHYGNWEWGGAMFSSIYGNDPQLYVVYKPLSNKYFDKLSRKIRSRLGAIPVTMHDTFKTLLVHKNEFVASGLVADQTPPPESAYWTTFLNQETPVFWGTEKMARKLNYPIVFGDIQKVKRGYYNIHLEMLCKNPQDTIVGEISELHTKRLEKEIRNNPATWLWSHRRWKHKRMKQ